MPDIRTTRARNLYQKLTYAEVNNMDRDYPWITALAMVEAVDLLGLMLKQLECINQKLMRLDGNTRE